MIIDEKRKYIFIHIPKNAGSSMTQALISVGGHRIDKYDTHVPAEILSKDIPDYDSYFKFAFVRNPWDRMFSMYKFTLRRGWMPKDTTYEDFLSRDDLHITEACKYQDPVIPITKKSQLDFIRDEDKNLIVSYIGKHEAINDNFKYICDQIGIQTSLPYINASPGVNYRDAYNTKTKQFIEKYFEEDIDMFEYKF